MNRKSYLIAAAIVIGIAIWMGSGYVDFSRGSVPDDAPEAKASSTLMTVQVRQQRAKAVTRRLQGEGQAESNRAVEVRAETTGRIRAVLAPKGARVKAGDPLARIAMNDRQARLDQVKALLAQRQADYAAVRKLGSKGYQSSSRVREAYAALQSAQADLAAIREDIDHTVIRAPFGGIVNDRSVEVGDYVSPGDQVAMVVDNDPLKVVVHIAQQNVGAIAPHARASVDLATGETLDGIVSFIAAAADPQTRTFRVEVDVANPDGLPAGVSATVRIPVDTVQAQFLSPALLALDDKGVLGVKTVDDGGRVRFHAVQVVRTELDGVWVTGLPETARVITIGQGFVRNGEPVKTTVAEQSGVTVQRPSSPALKPET